MIFCPLAHAWTSRLTRIDESVGSVLSPSADSLDLSDEEEGRGRRSSRLRGKRSVNRDEVDAGDVIAYKRRTRVSVTRANVQFF